VALALPMETTLWTCDSNSTVIGILQSRPVRRIIKSTVHYRPVPSFSVEATLRLLLVSQHKAPLLIWIATFQTSQTAHYPRSSQPTTNTATAEKFHGPYTENTILTVSTPTNTCVASAPIPPNSSLHYPSEQRGVSFAPFVMTATNKDTPSCSPIYSNPSITTAGIVFWRFPATF
jgi:hypothetical protein